jgi:type IV pilus assembly protein PilV
MMLMTSRSRQRGFNLIEVMAAVLVVTFGLLGLARIEAVAVNETTTSDLRSLVAIEVQSLAASMHANPDYWQTSLGGALSCTITGSTVCSSLNAVYDCASTNTCTPTQVAAYDVQKWAGSMNTLLPGFVSIITCTSAVTNAANSSGSTQTEYGCDVQVKWTEKYVAINKAASDAQLNARSVTSKYETTVWP